MRWVILLLCLPFMAAADQAPRRYADVAEANQWRGVGLLSVGGGVCTGTLIAPDVVLTAAHCVADFKTQTITPPQRIVFYAGWKDGKSTASRKARKVLVHPGYFAAGAGYNPQRIRVDVARVILSGPILTRDAPFYPLSDTPDIGGAVALVGYSGGRLGKLSVQRPCRILARETEFLRTTCLSQPGASGSPVFALRGGRSYIVALNTGTRIRAGTRSALGLTLNHVRGWLGAGGPASAPTTSAPSSGFKRVKP